MHLFQIPTKSLRERATGWQVRFSPLFLVAFLMIYLVATIAFVPAADKAHASSILTQKIQLSSLDMIDQQHGWAFGGTGTHVFTTHQGPEHWVDVTPALLIQEPTDTITTSFFQNATHGYIGILQTAGISLLSTSDGGRTWKTTSFTIPGTVPGEAAIIQIQFLDAQHGWLSFIRDQRNPGEFDFVMMSTTNGGKTWQTVLDTYTNPTSLPIPYSTTLRFTFVNPLDGWVTGVGLSADVYLEATHDGGKTWSRSNIMPIKGTNSDIELTQGHGPYWQNSQNGTLFVRFDTAISHLTAYRTLDGGKSWILGPSTTATSFQELSNLSFLNALEGWSFGMDGANRYVIHHTSDSGLKWDVFYPAGLIQANVDQVPQNLTFINTTTGWLIIKDGQGNYHLFQTNTGGHTWQALHPVTE